MVLTVLLEKPNIITLVKEFFLHFYDALFNFYLTLPSNLIIKVRGLEKLNYWNNITIPDFNSKNQTIKGGLFVIHPFTQNMLG